MLIMASGIAVWMISYPLRGICVVSSPAPARRQAEDDNMAAPILP